MNTIVETIKSALQTTTAPDNARDTQRIVAAALKDAGLNVRWEQRTPDYGRNRPGRIDLVATNGHERAAIEIDQRAPRAKSLQKLLNFDGRRVIVLRGHQWTAAIEGIDAIINIATEATK